MFIKQIVKFKNLNLQKLNKYLNVHYQFIIGLTLCSSQGPWIVNLQPFRIMKFSCSLWNSHINY